MNAAEVAVAHDEHVIARPCIPCDRFDQRAEIGMDLGLAVERRQRGSDVPAEIGGIAIDTISVAQALRERCLHRSELHRV